MIAPLSLQFVLELVIINWTGFIAGVQYVDLIPKKFNGVIEDMLTKVDANNIREKYIKEFELGPVLKRKADDLSGGELQRFACATACVTPADIYLFDEPSSYLDVRQRLAVARVIRELVRDSKYILHLIPFTDRLLHSDHCVLLLFPNTYR